MAMTQVDATELAELRTLAAKTQQKKAKSTARRAIRNAIWKTPAVKEAYVAAMKKAGFAPKE